MVGNTYDSLRLADFYIIVYDQKGSVDWTYALDAGLNSSDYATDVEVDNQGNIYVVGAGHSSPGTNFDIILVKIKHNGSFIWSNVFNGADSLDDLPTAVKYDNYNGIYVCGTVSTISDGQDYVTLKYDTSGNFIWQKQYDYNGNNDIAEAINIEDPSEVIVTGISESSDSIWEYATIGYFAVDGSLQSVNRNVSGSGRLDYPKDIVKDEADNYYITGSEKDSVNTHLKIIKMDSTLSIVWTAKDSTVLDSRGNSLVLDDSNNIYVTGYERMDSLQASLIVLKFNSSGNVVWKQHFNYGTDENLPVAWYEGTNITYSNGSIYATGYIENGLNRDILLLQYTTQGELRLNEIYDGLGGGVDFPTNLYVKENSVIVTGSSNSGEGQQYVSIKYELWEKPKIIEYDSSARAINYGNELVVRFNPEYIDTSFINNEYLEWSVLDSFLAIEIVDTVYKLLNIDGDGVLRAYKIYKHFKSNDTISLTYGGDTIKTPPLWSTVVVEIPDSLPLNAAVDSLSKVAEIIYSEKNFIYELQSIPDDPYYPQQYGLFSNPTYPGADINVKYVWDNYGDNCIFIKMGIIDYGNASQYYNNKDLPNRIKNDKLPFYYSNGHATSTIGVIAAIKNNEYAISGICREPDIYLRNANNKSLAEIANLVHELALKEKVHLIHFGFANKNYYSVTLMDVIDHAYHMQTSFIAPRGNEGNDELAYPSCYDDDRIMSVGASGIDGFRANGTGNGSGDDIENGSSWGNDMDFLAPGVKELIVTLYYGAAIGGQYPDVNLNFSGTSAAAAHVTGVVGLLQAYLNYYGTYPSPVAPEDIEQVLQKGAKNVSYLQKSAWGLINAGNTFDLVNTNDYLMLRRSWKSVLGTQNPWKVDQQIELKHGFYGLAKGTYKVDIYKVSVNQSHSISPPASANALVADSWIRNSASNLWDKPDANNVVFPYSKAILLSANESSASLEGYYYHFKEKVRSPGPNKPMDEWWPGNPVTEEFAMAYTLYIEKDGAVGIAKDIERKYDLRVFPNPASDYIVISGTWGKKNLQSISCQLLNVSGRVLLSKEILGAEGVLNTAHLSSGIYILRIQVGNNIINKKIILQ